jgi:eukaryotic-like serine/threonine-protein kinase
LPSGHLVYIRQGTLYAVPLDLNHLEVRSSPTPLVDGVSYDSTFGYGQLDVSQTGTLVYRRNGGATLHWIDEAGRTEPILPKPSQSVWPRVSPDGKQIALTTTEAGETSVWIHDLSTGRATRAATGARYYSLWTQDSRYLVLGGATGLSWVRVNQPEAPQPLTRGGIQVPVSFSRDGTRMAYYGLSAGSHFDLWTVPIQSSNEGLVSGRPELFLRTAAIETYPTFSPDGRWIAYTSSESGNMEVYVRAFPDNGRAVKVSSGGGSIPRWSPKGRDLYYRSDDHRIFVAAYRTEGGRFSVGNVRVWSATRLFDTGVFQNYDVAADGRIVALLPAGKPEERQSENHVTIMLNFFDRVRQRVSSSER